MHISATYMASRTRSYPPNFSDFNYTSVAWHLDKNIADNVWDEFSLFDNFIQNDASIKRETLNKLHRFKGWECLSRLIKKQEYGVDEVQVCKT